MASTRPPPSRPLDLDLTIVSAKNLKNVNWKNNGVLKPYCVFWVDPANRIASKSDDSGSTRPVWNEWFTLPLTLYLHESIFFLDIFHSVPSETPNPLVATLRVPLNELPDPDDLSRIRTFELTRPSGRPQGKIRVKLGVRERPVPVFKNYHFNPPPSHHYPSAPPPFYQSRDYREVPFSPAPSPSPSPSLSQLYNLYSSGYYHSSVPPPPLAPRPVGGYSGPSAPADLLQFDQKPVGAKELDVGAVAVGVGGLSLGEGQGERISEKRARFNPAARDGYSNYHVDY